MLSSHLIGSVLYRGCKQQLGSHSLRLPCGTIITAQAQPQVFFITNDVPIPLWDAMPCSQENLRWHGCLEVLSCTANFNSSSSIKD